MKCNFTELIRRAPGNPASSVRRGDCQPNGEARPNKKARIKASFVIYGAPRAALRQERRDSNIVPPAGTRNQMLS